ncbi:TonB-dependent receptor [Saccharophagus degradans]|uniref:TonB-dependent receptor n=1 Tax=Saccharophagus degradans TaxID=86304 RepID=UPI001C0876CB|nr:TonB-dependent receptor [Saccharophagus degradans]MBU2986036.1 TonB-dependent receptor [Saccharophagus degradans]
MNKLNSFIFQSVKPMLNKNISSLMLAGVIAPLFSISAFAQDKDNVMLEEVVVTATRQALQDALTLKRETTSISDVLASGDIGEIPSLSVAEALEAIPGATTHRLKGSGSQVSLRGLGPTLGLETFNGRTVTTGSENRSVNFQQFPSELMDKIQIYKSQSADMIEGGTSGVVELKTVRPLDYGKNVTVVDVRGKFNSYAARQDDNDGFGYRGSASHINQFETDFGPVGVSVGVALYDHGNPEESYNPSSSTTACVNQDWTSQEAMLAARSTSFKEDCAPTNPAGARGTAYTDATGVLASGADLNDVYIVNNSGAYRNLNDNENRRAFMGAVQWQPSDDWEFNVDLQLSSKSYEEARSEIQADNMRRGHYDVVLDPNSYNALSWKGTSQVRLDNNMYRRVEDYVGGGFAVTFTPTDRLTLDADLSYSDTHRSRNQRYVRFRTSDYIDYSFVNASDTPELTFGGNVEGGVEFDPTDLSSFDLGATIRSRKFDQKHTMEAIRLDADYAMDEGSFITSYETGIRYSTNKRVVEADDSQETGIEVIYALYTDGDMANPTVSNTELRGRIAQECGIDFPNDNFGAGTNAAKSAPWASFDTECAISLVTNGKATEGITHEQALAAAGMSDVLGDDINVSETVTAAYIKANYSTELGSIPVYGNFGVRVLETTVESIGYKVGYTAVSCNPDDAGVSYSADLCGFTEDASGDDWYLKRDGRVETLTDTNSITSFLPSVTAIFDISDEFLIRSAIYRALSRENIDWYANGYSYGEDEFDDRNGVNGVLTDDIRSASTGNPYLKPYMSWNADVSFEWYFSPESSISTAFYYKDFEATYANERVETTQTVGVFGGDESLGAGTAAPGEIVYYEQDVAVTKFVNVDQNNSLYGLELNAQTVFTMLPSPFDGLGTRLTYNYAQTDYVTQDAVWGDAVDEDGNVIVGLPNLDEGSFFGQSDHSGSLTVFWDIGDLNLQWITKYRSEYLQPNLGIAAGNRWIAPFTLMDFAASYKINKTFKVRATVQNAFDEPQVGNRVSKTGNSTLWSATGPKFELGVTAKF